MIQHSTFHRPSNDSAVCELNVRTRDLTNVPHSGFDTESSVTNEDDGFSVPAPPPNTREMETDLRAAEYEVWLGRSETSFISNINSISSLSGYEPESSTTDSTDIADVVDSSPPPPPSSPMDISSRASPVNINDLMNSSLLLSLEQTRTSPPPVSLSEIALEPIIPARLNSNSGTNSITRHVTERGRSSSCPSRASPPRVPKATVAETGQKRGRDTANLSALSHTNLDNALLESNNLLSSENNLAQPSSTTPPQQPPALTRLRPLPSRASGIRPPSLHTSPDRRNQAAPPTAKPATKRVRRHRE